jgi:hypothetical protein
MGLDLGKRGVARSRYARARTWHNSLCGSADGRSLMYRSLDRQTEIRIWQPIQTLWLVELIYPISWLSS